MSELTTVGVANGDTRLSNRRGLSIQQPEKGDYLSIILPKLEYVESNLTLSGEIEEYDNNASLSPDFANWTQAPTGFSDEDLRQYHYRCLISSGHIATTR